MKIVEIISENVDESIASRLLGGAARLGAGLLRTGQKQRLIDQFARSYRPGDILDRARLARAFPDENIDDIEQAIIARSRNVHRDVEFARNIQGIQHRWEQTKTIIKGLMNVFKVAVGGYLASIMFEPFSHYYERMELAQQWLYANDPKERWTEAQFESFHRAEMVALINKLATILISYKLLNLPNRAIIGIFSRSASNAITQLSAIPRMWLATQIANDPKAAETFSISILNNVFGQNFVENTIGAIAATADEYIFDWVKKAEEAEKDQQPATKPSTTQEKPVDQKPPKAEPSTTQEKPVDQVPPKTKTQLEIEKLKPFNPKDWEFYAPNYTRHIPTGKIYRNVDLFEP